MSYRLDNLVASCPILPKYLFWTGRANGDLRVGVRHILSAQVTLWLLDGDVCALSVLSGVSNNGNGVCPHLVAGSDSWSVAGPEMGPANTDLATTKIV